jgi:hypothetical protein
MSKSSDSSSFGERARSAYNTYAQTTYYTRFDLNNPLATNERELLERHNRYAGECYPLVDDTVTVFNFGGLGEERVIATNLALFHERRKDGGNTKFLTYSADIANLAQKQGAKVLRDQGRFVAAVLRDRNAPVVKLNGKEKKQGEGFTDWYEKAKKRGESIPEDKPQIPVSRHARTLEATEENAGFSIEFLTLNPDDYIPYLENFFKGKKVDNCVSLFGTMAHIPGKEVRERVAEMLGFITRGSFLGTFPGKGLYPELQVYYGELRAKGESYKEAKGEGDIYYHKTVREGEIEGVQFEAGQVLDPLFLARLAKEKPGDIERLVEQGVVTEHYYHIFTVDELKGLQQDVLRGMGRAKAEGKEPFDMEQPEPSINTVGYPPKLSKNKELDSEDVEEVKVARKSKVVHESKLPHTHYLQMEVCNPYTIERLPPSPVHSPRNSDAAQIQDGMEGLKKIGAVFQEHGPNIFEAIEFLQQRRGSPQASPPGSPPKTSWKDSATNPPGGGLRNSPSQ